MNYWFQNHFTPAESMFAAGMVVVIFAAIFLLHDEVDSPRGLVLRGLLISVYFLQATLFSVLAWEFSPRVQMDATVVARNWNRADLQTPAKVTFARGDGSKITLRVPVEAVQGLKQDQAAAVTYLAWSNRVVAFRYVDGGTEKNFPLSELGFDLKVMAENYLVGLAVLGAGLGVFFWIRRKDGPPELVGLAGARKS